MASFDLIHSPEAELGEGPVWHDEALWWVDIHAGTLNRLNPAKGDTSRRPTNGSLGAACPCADGRWLLAQRNGFFLLDYETGHLAPFASIGMPAGHRLNDGKCDPAGRFWVGSMSEPPRHKNAFLFALEPNGRVTKVLEGISLSNGLAWSSDGGTMFHADSLEQTVTAYDFECAHGTLGKSRVLVRFPESMGCPDGLTIDKENHLWIAMWGGSSVVRIHGETGEILEKIELPVTQPSSCCFGGPQCDQLFVTSAWSGMNELQRRCDPLAGSIFRISTSTSGFPPVPFRNTQPTP